MRREPSQEIAATRAAGKTVGGHYASPDLGRPFAAYAAGEAWQEPLAILALVVVNALGESPWGVFSVAMTIPIALFMGCYLRFVRPGAVSEVSGIGVVLLLLAIVAGGWVAGTDWGKDMFTLSPTALSWAIIIYGFAAAVLPVWLLLAPRDYLSTFMKVGTIVLLAVVGLATRARDALARPLVNRGVEGGTGVVMLGFAGALAAEG